MSAAVGGLYGASREPDDCCDMGEVQLQDVLRQADAQGARFAGARAEKCAVDVVDVAGLGWECCWVCNPSPPWTRSLPCCPVAGDAWAGEGRDGSDEPRLIRSDLIAAMPCVAIVSYASVI